MTLNDYARLYNEILEMSFDMDGISAWSGISSESIEKCKYVSAILETLNDVPRHKIESIFSRKKIDFDYIEFIGTI
jgi:hypothetical protein